MEARRFRAASTDFGGDLRGFLEVAFGVDLRNVGASVAEHNLRRFELELCSDFRRVEVRKRFGVQRSTPARSAAFLTILP